MGHCEYSFQPGNWPRRRRRRRRHDSFATNVGPNVAA